MFFRKIENCDFFPKNRKFSKTIDFFEKSKNLKIFDFFQKNILFEKIFLKIKFLHEKIIFFGLIFFPDKV